MPLVVPLILVAASTGLPARPAVSISVRESVTGTARTDDDWWNEELHSRTIIAATIHSYDNLLLRLLLADAIVVLRLLLEDIVSKDEDDEDDFSAGNEEEEVAASDIDDINSSSQSATADQEGAILVAISFLPVAMAALNCGSLVGIPLFSSLSSSFMMTLPPAGVNRGGFSYSIFIVVQELLQRDGSTACLVVSCISLDKYAAMFHCRLCSYLSITLSLFNSSALYS